MRSLKRFLTLATILSLNSCVGTGPLDADKEEVPPPGGKGDAWNFGGAPTRFEIPLETQIDGLPSEGRVEVVPWSDTYWPTMADSFNVRWNGPRELSPLEKYDVAFNNWVPPAGFFELRPLTAENCASGQWDPEYYEALGPAARYWSDNHGNGRARNGLDDDGDGSIDECDDLDGMEGWWGSCHAWTPASMLEAEPLEAAEFNGVTFYPSDIKALIIMMYEQSSQIAIGDRCQLDNPPRDASGRITDDACRNTNAGAFHLLMTNLLGIRRQPFGEDRVAGEQVWNQPLVGYRIQNQREVDEAEALRLLRRTETAYPFNDAAERFVEVEVEVDYVFETNASTEPSTPRIDEFIHTDRYHYVLELDAEGNIIGGEWIGSLNTWNWSDSADRPDFVWLPIGPGRMLNPHVTVGDIRQLHRLSRPDTRSQQVITYSDAPMELIPEFPFGPLTRSFQVTEDVTPSEVSVYVNVSHDWVYDVVVTLVRGDERVVLFNRNPRGTSTAFVATVPVPELAGQNARGEWRLEVADRDSRSRGRLIEWSLNLTVPSDGPSPDPEPDPDPDPDPEPQERTYSPSGGALAIPDADPNGVVSTLQVPDSMSAAQVLVNVDITHTYRGDLQVLLERNGVQRVLHNRQGGAADDLSIEFDVTDLAGSDIQGSWQLIVRDLAGADTGEVVGWSLTAR